MRLWTAQTPEIYKSLIDTGVYHTKESEINDFEFWKRSYDWLVAKMIEHIGSPPVGVNYPIWLWYIWNGKHHKPDLRSRTTFGPKGLKQVLLEVEVPDDQVLLSDFDAWHFVLNDYVILNAQNEIEYEEMYKHFESLSKEQQEAERIKSWEKVFDITPFENDFYCKGKWVQATIWELRSDQIVRAIPFTI